MKEIEFRGKRRYGGEWINGSLLTDNKTVFNILYPEEQLDGKLKFRHFEVIPETIGQMLKIKDNKSFFEGDIGITKDGENLVVILTWVEEFSMCSWLTAEEYKEYQEGRMDLDKTMFWTYSFEDKYVDDIEVIGNIHDNPDLIKK